MLGQQPKTVTTFTALLHMLGGKRLPNLLHYVRDKSILTTKHSKT